MLEINIGTLTVQVLNIIIFFSIVLVFFWKPLMKVIDDRRSEISGNIHSAETAKAEAGEIKSSYSQRFAKLQAEGDDILKQYVNEGERQKNDLIQKGKDEAKRIVEHANLEISRDKEKALADVKNITADMAVDLSKRLLIDYLDPEAQKNLAQNLAEKAKKL